MSSSRECVAESNPPSTLRGDLNALETIISKKYSEMQENVLVSFAQMKAELVTRIENIDSNVRSIGCKLEATITTIDKNRLEDLANIDLIRIQVRKQAKQSAERDSQHDMRLYRVEATADDTGRWKAQSDADKAAAFDRLKLALDEERIKNDLMCQRAEAAEVQVSSTRDSLSSALKRVEKSDKGRNRSIILAILSCIAAIATAIAALSK